MEPANIQRDVQADHTPTENVLKLGKVTRMRSPEASMGGPMFHRGMVPVDGLSATAAARHSMIVTWSLILSLTTLLVIGGFMMFWLRSHKRPHPAADATRSEMDVRIVSKFVSPTEDVALDLVKRALANRDPAKVATFFRLGGATPAEVVEFLAETPARDGCFDHSVWLTSMDVDGLLLEGVLTVYSGKDEPTARLAFLTPDDAGVWKMDFDAFARTSRPPWKDLLEGRADVAQVRVFVVKDTYFNGPFKDESRWICFGIGSPEASALLPDGQDLLCGYCRVDSPQAKAMERIFSDDEKIHRVTLEIRRTAGAESRQFEITRVMAEDWVLSATAFDAKFD